MLEDLLKEVRSVHTAARTDDTGEVLERRGADEMETTCAVAAVSAQGLERLGESLSAGALRRWYVVTGNASYFVSGEPQDSVVAVGASTKNPEPISKAIHRFTGKP